MGFLYGRYLRQYYMVLIQLLAFSEKARREGLLALEDEMEDLDNHFMKIGLRLILDGCDGEDVDRVLSFMIENEKNKREKQLKKAIKQALLDIQAGNDQEFIKIKYNSFMDIHNYTALSRDRTRIIEECNGFFINPRIKKYTGQKYFNACLEVVGVEKTNLAYVL
jgi:flagellar motor component MotA